MASRTSLCASSIPSLVAATLLLGVSAPALVTAQTVEPDPVSEPNPERPVAPVEGAPIEESDQYSTETFRLDIGLGLKGGLTGAWALEVPENSDTSISDETKAYYSAFGLGGDVGVALDIRALGIVGVETGLRVSFDNAQGFNELKDGETDELLYRVNQEQQSTSLRIPLLLKLSTPNGVVRPTFAFGLEWARQLDSSINYSVDNEGASEPDSVTARRLERNQIEASNYRLLTGAFGIEIDLGAVKIPIELRAQYNLDYGGDAFDPRVRIEGSGRDAVYYYDGAYQGHFGVTVGLIYDLGLLL